MLTVVVYHVKAPSTLCFDGFAAATVAWRKFGDNAEYLKALYYKKLPIERFIGKECFFLDFSYDVEYMDQIAAVAKSLVVLDHHMPKAETFANRPYITFSANESGALMAWKYWFADQPVPEMLKIIDDGDRFLNVHPDVDTFHASLSVEEESFKCWSSLMDRLSIGFAPYEAFIHRGQVVLECDHARIQTLVRESFPITLCGVQGLAVNSNKFYAHNAGIALAEHSKTFGAVFYLRPDGNVEVSLRRVDPNIDVFEIAKTFGGGGHKGGAAFSVSLAKFSELLNIPGKSGKIDLYARIEAATKLFQHTLDQHSYDPVDNGEEQFLEHMQNELGSNIADELGFSITKSVRHHGMITRLLSSIALFFGMEKVVQDPKWYHKLLPYTIKPVLVFDEDSIRNVLLESSSDRKEVNKFFVERLLETVTSSQTAELITSTYYLHVTVSLPGSSLTVKHTFEVSK